MLSTPPAFILSQDQTLMLIVVWTCQNFFWHSYLCLDSSLNFSLLPSFRSSAFGIFRVALLFICQGTRLSFAQSIELRSNHWAFVQSQKLSFSFVVISRRQLNHIIISISLCQQLFNFFWNLFFDSAVALVCSAAMKLSIAPHPLLVNTKNYFFCNFFYSPAFFGCFR